MFLNQDVIRNKVGNANTLPICQSCYDVGKDIPIVAQRNINTNNRKRGNKTMVPGKSPNPKIQTSETSDTNHSNVDGEVIKNNISSSKKGSIPNIPKKASKIVKAKNCKLQKRGPVHGKDKKNLNTIIGSTSLGNYFLPKKNQLLNSMTSNTLANKACTILSNTNLAIKPPTTINPIQYGKQVTANQYSHLLSGCQLVEGEVQMMIEKFDIINVSPDENCALYVCMHFLQQKNKITENLSVTEFRFAIHCHMKKHESFLRSPQFGLQHFYKGLCWRELYDNIYRENNNLTYMNGCGEDGWINISNLFPVLNHMYGDFYLMVFSDNGPRMYSMGDAVNGYLNSKTKDIIWDVEINLHNNVLVEKSKSMLYTLFNDNHYYILLPKNSP